MKMTTTLLSFFCVWMLTGLSAQPYDIYISDAGNFNNPPWQILKFDQNGDNPEVFIDDHLAWPQDIVFLEEDHFVLISNLNTNQIARFDASTGDYIDDFATGMGGPTRMKVYTDELLYVLQWSGNGKVLRYQTDGTFVDEFTDVAVSNSIGLDWDSEGNLYVSSYDQSIIRKFDTSGNDLGIFIDSDINGPTNIWFDDNGHLFVLNWGGTTVSEFDADGNYIGSFITGLGQPEGVDFLDSGNILIGNGQNGSVKLFDSEGNFLEDLVASGEGGLIRPNAVILREVTVNSTQEVVEEINFIFPNQGQQFFVDSAWASKLTSIQVFNGAGQTVHSSTVADTLIWQAEDQAEGFYLMVAETKDGKKLSQKVMVTQ